MTDTTNLEGKLREYIKHLYKARSGIEKEQDKMMGPVPPDAFGVEMTKVARLEAEFITLGAVIRDLEKIAYPKEFSYWNF